MQKYIIANWKMNGSKALLNAFNSNLKAKSNTEVIICPPMHLLSQEVSFSKGSQNLSWNYPNSGAFTGEVSGQMLAESGCKYVLIGHSERRQYFGENNEILSKKLEFALQNNLTPIFCFGESLEDFQNNQTLNVIEQQLSIVNDSKNIIFAYEPIWSIGTGLVPKKSDVSKVCDFIKKKFANDAKIVYGGSVNSGNAEEILNEWPVVGILVGGSSLKLEEFQKIIDFA